MSKEKTCPGSYTVKGVTYMLPASGNQELDLEEIKRLEWLSSHHGYEELRNRANEILAQYHIRARNQQDIVKVSAFRREFERDIRSIIQAYTENGRKMAGLQERVKAHFATFRENGRYMVEAYVIALCIVGRLSEEKINAATFRLDKSVMFDFVEQGRREHWDQQG